MLHDVFGGREACRDRISVCTRAVLPVDWLAIKTITLLPFGVCAPDFPLPSVMRSKPWLQLLSFIVVILAVVCGLYKVKLFRVVSVLRLFDRDVIAVNFRSMWQQGFSHRVARRGPAVAQFVDSPMPLPKSFRYNGSDIDTNQWLEDHWTTRWWC